MSLTSLLKDTDSVVSRFFRETLPQTRSVTSEHNPGLKHVETIRLPEDLKRWYPTLGTAVDYRLRYYLPAAPSDELIAYQGAVALTFQDGPSLPAGIIDEFFNYFGDLLSELQPAAKRLPPEQESELCRHCFVLALFEQVFRVGPNPNSPLFSMEEPSVEAMLGLAPEVCVEDLCSQSWLFHTRLGDQIGGQHVLNPIFDGSNDIGGADADIILDRCLIDFKSTINPKITSNWLYQLLGYVLLDYTDQHQINKVGIYFSRQGVLLQWDLTDLVAELSAGPQASVTELRARLNSLLTALNKT